MRIVAISGKRGAGKDTLAMRFVERGWTRVSFAQTLKQHVRDFFDMSVDQTDGHEKEKIDPRYGLSPRQLMINVGQFYRSYDPLFWVKRATNNLRQNGNYVISDLRFKNEAEYLLSLDALLVRVNRRKDLNIYQGEINDPSETELDNFENFRYTVPEDKNVTIADLEKVAADITKRMGYEYHKSLTDNDINSIIRSAS